MNTPGDIVRSALDRLMATGAITETGRASIQWFYNHAMVSGWEYSDAGKAICVDGATIYQMLNGRYIGNYDDLVNKINRYRDQKMAVTDTGDYVETSTWEKVGAVCRHAQRQHIPAMIFGVSQIGKTKALEEFQRRDTTGTVKLIRMPAAPTMARIQHEFAKALHISTRLHPGMIRYRIMNAVTPDTLIIVDELHQAFLGTTPKRTIEIIEWLREVYDRTQCGMVFVGTNLFREELENGKMAMVLEQFRRRGIISLRLPEKPPKSDIHKIAASFGLGVPEGAAVEIVDRMITSSGLKQYVSFLQSAKNLAANKKEGLRWGHFVRAYDAIQSLSINTKE
jgi:DNA transposition AAA+ family ATPase